MGRQTLGDFEQLVLLAVLRLGHGAYTVSVMQEIEERTSRSPTHAAVYVALRRLEERGLVESHLGESTPTRGGRAKRFVRVTPDALTMLEAARDDLLSMWRGIQVADGTGA